MFVIWYLLFTACLPLLTASHLDCSKENFPCGDKCVNRSKWCDKHSDCDDKTDEAYCKEAGWWNGIDPNKCLENENLILCDSGLCIPIVAKCDGIKDCDDGFDEKYCGTEATTELSSSIESDKIFNEKDDFLNEYKTESTTISSITENYKEDEPTTSASKAREIYSSRISDFRPTSTSYYEKRLKEADAKSKSLPSLTFPKTVPTRAYPITSSSATIMYVRNLTKPTTSILSTTTTRRAFIAEPRSQRTHSSRYNAQQRQSENQRTNYFQPFINHYQLPTNHHQTPFNHYKPSSHRQLHNNQFQPRSNPYQPHTNQHQPSNNHYQTPSNRYQLPPNQYQPPNNQHQPYPSNTHKEHRPLNGEPNVRYQTNYFQPYDTKLMIKKRFYFDKDYATLYGGDNTKFLREGVQWLLRHRSATGDWGIDTSRAVVALALANNSFLYDNNDDDEIIKKRFMIQLGADLLENNTKNFNINRLSRAINGLLAVCEDPTDFHGLDLTDMLQAKMRENNRNSPFVSLTLCLSNKSLSSSEIESLMKLMMPSKNPNERAKDMMSAAMMAFSCHVHQSRFDSTHYTSVRSTLRSAVANLLEYFEEDGSFGSVYSTALAAQALMSTNESSNWRAEKTMSFLQQQQREDGSFGDLLATYLVLPALSGRSLLHLRNIPCNPVKRETATSLSPQEIIDFNGPKQYVRISLYFGYPLVNSQSLFLLVPRGINFLDVMRVAEYQDKNFRFALDNVSSKVYSLSYLPDDTEMGLSWHLYVKKESSPYVHEPNGRERFNGDLRSLHPKSGEHVIFWYHSNDLRV